MISNIPVPVPAATGFSSNCNPFESQQVIPISIFSFSPILIIKSSSFFPFWMILEDGEFDVKILVDCLFGGEDGEMMLIDEMNECWGEIAWSIIDPNVEIAFNNWDNDDVDSKMINESQIGSNWIFSFFKFVILFKK